VQVVNFNFKPEVAREDRESVVDRIKQWDSVVEAAPLKPDTRNPWLRRIYHAYVEDGTDVGETVERLSGLPEVELAEAPAQRHLIG
jgi:hypothetical protein